MLKHAKSLNVHSLIGLAAGLIAIGIFATVTTIWALRSDTISDAQRQAGSLAAALAEQTASSVKSIDLILGQADERFNDFEADGAIVRRPKLAGQSIH